MIRPILLTGLAPLVLSVPASATTLPGGDCTMTTVMREDFDAESIASHHVGPARWTAHTPWGGDFGDARFADPGPGSPFKVADHQLAITASKGPDGHWQSGLIAAADAAGEGTGTRYGYFEARMKMPPGPGTWPAFWLAALKPVAGSDGNVEVDIVEYYGKFTSAYRNAVHVWYHDPAKTTGDGHEVRVSTDSLVEGFHDYGVDISPQRMVFFLDGHAVWEHPTPPELDSPLYPIVNLALGSGWPIDQTPNPSVLLVQYVHVFGRGPGPAEGCPPGAPPTP